MTYEEALKYIHGTHKFGIKLGLDNIRTLLELMGNPQDKLKYVHVAGTNGKGSTVAYISNILIESGYNVGIYTSPYLERFTERIKINTFEISEDDLARITQYVKSKVDDMLQRGYNHPTEFEIVTAIAFQYYYEEGCDIVVLEVGLGGRYDSTNVIGTPLLSVITTISYDHMDRLGNSLEEIAFEKAGIIKENGDVIHYPCNENIKRVFEDKCRKSGARLHSVDFDTISVREFGIDGQVFDFQNFKGLCISLLGDHQVRNAALSIAVSKLLALKGFSVTEESIRKGLYSTKWSGRLEVVRKIPKVMVDGAHNSEAAEILSECLRKYFPEKKIDFIVGVLKDKDYETMIKAVIPIAKSFRLITPQSDRALPAEQLAIFIKPYCNNISVSDRIVDAVKSCLKEASEDDVICAFGSLTFLGEIKIALMQN